MRVIPGPIHTARCRVYTPTCPASNLAHYTRRDAGTLNSVFRIPNPAPRLGTTRHYRKTPRSHLIASVSRRTGWWKVCAAARGRSSLVVHTPGCWKLWWMHHLLSLKAANRPSFETVFGKMELGRDTIDLGRSPARLRAFGESDPIYDLQCD